jgi:ribosomal protein L12E/L44/L45/RPP1/RPP2
MQPVIRQQLCRAATCAVSAVVQEKDPSKEKKEKKDKPESKDSKDKKEKKVHNQLAGISSS